VNESVEKRSVENGTDTPCGLLMYAERALTVEIVGEPSRLSPTGCSQVKVLPYSLSCSNVEYALSKHSV